MNGRSESHERMQAGLALLEGGRAKEALAHFDRAVELREPWPWQEDAEAAWMLAAAWINRADALRAANGETWQAETLRSLDRGIEVLETLPFDRHPELSDRLVLALIKRADTLAESAPTTAADAYDTAAATLAAHGRGDTAEGWRLAVMLWSNRAQFLAASGQAVEAVAAARRAVVACRKLEASGGRDSAGVKTRATLAWALATALEQPDGASISEDWIGETTDAIEDALALAADLGLHHQVTRDLLRCGAKIYRVCQPHFLGEFVLSRMPRGDAALRKEMLAELWLARADAERRVIAAPHDDEVVQRQSRILESLKRPLEVFGRD